MSNTATQLETAIFISPDTHIRVGEHSELPLHINVVDRFMASAAQAEKLSRHISAPLLRSTFEITGLGHSSHETERLQRLGGSVLHGIREEIAGAMNQMKIVHGTALVPDGSDETWYTGTWQVPRRRTEITALHIAQAVAETQGWQVLRTYTMHVPSNDFRLDPLYLESLYNPVNKRRSA